MSKVPFYKHDLGQEELRKVEEVLNGEILTSGEYTFELERRIANYLGTKYALATNSCTGSLHLSLLAYDIGEGDEVITTPMTFVATAESIIAAGAKPVFVDVDLETGNLDVNLIENAITEKTKAIMPVHLYGLMCDMRAMRKLADKYNLKIFEDSAHCFEGKRDGCMSATLGETASFSFYATKNLACGEGGAMAFNDDSVYEKLKLLRLHGMTKTAADRSREGYTHWDVPIYGWKYNLSNIQAALVLPQFDRLDKKLQKRHALADYYISKLSEIEEIKFPQTVAGATHARHLFTIWVENRDEVIMELQKAGISAMVNYRPVHLLEYFKQKYSYKSGDFPIAEKIGNSTISIPFYPDMPFEYVDTVVDALKNIVQKKLIKLGG